MRKSKGFTLMELIVAIVLLSTVLFTATTLLLNFQKQHIGFIQTESSLMETVLAANEEIVSKIIESNQVTIGLGGGTDNIDIRIDEPNTPSDFTDDPVYIYALNGTNLERTSYANEAAATTGGGTASVIASDVSSLDFQMDAAGGLNDPATVKNTVKITLTAQPTGGPLETVETAVTARCRSAI